MTNTNETALSDADHIRTLNDRFRTTFWGGKVFFTRGIIDMGGAFQSACVEAVQGFTDFSADNDPYGEHDFGRVVISGTPVFWKIDYYDRTLEAGSENPADAAATTRVLTILLASEY